MNLKALDELRGWIAATVDYGLGPDGTNLEQLRDIADAIEAEIAEKFMKLPVDADGVVIHVGDAIEYPNGRRDVVRFITFGDSGPTLNEGGWLTSRCYHVQPRTIEDVLREFAKRVLNSGHQWGLDAEETTAKYADELRELMGCAEKGERVDA